MGKTYKIIFGGKSCESLFASLIDGDVEVIDSAIEYSTNDDIDENRLRAFCKKQFLSLKDNPDNGIKTITSSTEERACVFEYDEAGKIRRAYEINSLLDDKNYRVNTVGENELRKSYSVLDSNFCRTSMTESLSIVGAGLLEIGGTIFGILDTLNEKYQLDNNMLKVSEHKAAIINNSMQFVPLFALLALAGIVVVGCATEEYIESSKELKKALRIKDEYRI